MDNAIDVGLIENNPEHPDIHSTPFRKDRLCGIAPPGHPLAGRAGVTLLLREKGSGSREILDACFALEQLSVRPLWESVSNQAIISGVAAGIGIAVLSELLVAPGVQTGRVSAFSLQPALERNFIIIRHKSKYLTPPLQAFMELCLDGQK